MPPPEPAGRCRVLLVHRYYWPDRPPYAQMLHRIATALAENGFEVHVLTGDVSYFGSERSRLGSRQCLEGGVAIHRIRLLASEKGRLARRFVNVCTFLGGLVAHVLASKRYGIIMTGTVPPVAAPFVGSLMAKWTGAKFIYHCQDIHPEAALSGSVIRRGLLSRALVRLDTRTCLRSARVVVLSEDMRRTMIARGVDPARLLVQNNFIVESDGADANAGMAPPKAPGQFRVVFAGNLGRFQGLETVIEGARLLAAEPRIQFVFAGEGALADELRALSGPLAGATVHFVGQVAPAVVDDLVRQSDLAIVALKRDVHRFAYPSKTISYLAAGARLLVMADSDSELVRELVAEDLAVSCPPGAATEFARAIRHAADTVRDRAADRRRAICYANDHFAAHVVLGKWIDVFRAET